MQLPKDEVAVVNVLDLYCAEVLQQPEGLCCVVTVPIQFSQSGFLAGDMSLALGNMPFSFSQMT